MKRHPSNSFYHRTIEVYIAIEIPSILRVSFDNMILNSLFTKSTEDDILSKIHTQNEVTPT